MSENANYEDLMASMPQDRKTEKEKNFTVVFGDEVAVLKDLPGFDDNGFAITDPKGIEKFGVGAYFVDKAWLGKDNLLGE